MALSETLYTLRRKAGLSQEQLAEKLDVSRQAVSKWEQGKAMPETEKLLSIARYFGVSLDDLIGDGPPSPQEPPTAPTEEEPSRRGRSALGLILALGGILALILWGLVLILSPGAGQQLAESSAIRLDGQGIFLLLSLGAAAVGVILLIKGSKH